MFTIVLLTTIACALAAPHYGYHNDYASYTSSHSRHEGSGSENFVNRDIFDTNDFWQDFNFKMSNLGTWLGEMHRHMPRVNSQEKIEGNLYKVSLWLPRCEPNTIVVKVKNGLLSVRAYGDVSERGDFRRRYSDERTLPQYVDDNGTWTYKDGLLTITFPLVQYKEQYGFNKLTGSDDDVVIVPNKTPVLKNTVEATTLRYTLKM